MFEFDQLCIRNPQTSLGSYIDDDTVTMSGSPDTVVRTLTSAAADLKWVFEGRLDVKLAADKATTFATNQ
eukprot:5453132-Pyramimonas_sp.AAC.1